MGYPTGDLPTQATTSPGPCLGRYRAKHYYGVDWGLGPGRQGGQTIVLRFGKPKSDHSLNITRYSANRYALRRKLLKRQIRSSTSLDAGDHLIHYCLVLPSPVDQEFRRSLVTLPWELRMNGHTQHCPIHTVPSFASHLTHQ